MKKLLLIALLMGACDTKQDKPNGPTQLNGYVQQTADGTLYYHEEVRGGMKFGIWIYYNPVHGSVGLQVVNITKDSLGCVR